MSAGLVARRLLCAALLLAQGGATAGAIVGPWFEKPEVRFRLSTPWEVASASPELAAGLEVELAPGWHAYWRNSGDAGYAPKVEPAPASAIVGARLDFPAPSRFDLPGGLAAFGYADRVIYPLTLDLAPAVAPPAARLALTVDLLVCAEECVPYTTTLVLEQPIGGPARPDEATAARLAAARARLPRPIAGLAGALAVEATWRAGTYPWATVELVFAGARLEARSPQLFFDSHPLLSIGRPDFVAERRGLVFRVPVRALDETRPLPANLDLAWTLTGVAIAGEPLALAGASPVRPSAGIPVRGLFGAVALAFVLLLVVLAVHRRRRRRASPIPPIRRSTP